MLNTSLNSQKTAKLGFENPTVLPTKVYVPDYLLSNLPRRQETWSCFLVLFLNFIINENQNLREILLHMHVAQQKCQNRLFLDCACLQSCATFCAS